MRESKSHQLSLKLQWHDIVKNVYVTKEKHIDLKCFRNFRSIALRILCAQNFFLAWLERARTRMRSELDMFCIETELFREINSRFLLNEIVDWLFKFHVTEYYISQFQ